MEAEGFVIVPSGSPLFSYKGVKMSDLLPSLSSQQEREAPWNETSQKLICRECQIELHGCPTEFHSEEIMDNHEQITEYYCKDCESEA